jgi:hypothetical protein
MRLGRGLRWSEAWCNHHVVCERSVFALCVDHPGRAFLAPAACSRPSKSREPVARPSAQHHHRACMLCKAICSGFGRWWCKAAAVPAVGSQKVAGEYGDRVTEHSLHLAAGLQQLQLTTTLDIIHRHSWQPSAAASSIAPKTAPRHAAWLRAKILRARNKQGLCLPRRRGVAIEWQPESETTLRATASNQLRSLIRQSSSACSSLILLRHRERHRSPQGLQVGCGSIIHTRGSAPYRPAPTVKSRMDPTDRRPFAFMQMHLHIIAPASFLLPRTLLFV